MSDMKLRLALLFAAFSACAPLSAGEMPVAPTPRPDPQPTAPSPPQACDKPVILVVWIEHLDRAKSKAYGEGLRASGIVRRNGGEYMMVGPPEMVLEGEWPADRGFVTERYPCRAAFEAMWFSDEYQKTLKPLREGSGDYTIALFAERPRPRNSAASVPVRGSDGAAPGPNQ